MKTKMDELTAKNFKSLSLWLKEMRTQAFNNTKEINTLRSQISMLITKNAELEQKLNISLTMR